MNSVQSYRPTLCLDFDGVIHSYDRGWQNGEIYGKFTPGFARWASHANQIFKLVIYSSRSASPEGIEAMRGWMIQQLQDQEIFQTQIDEFMGMFEFSAVKPLAFLTIDDRGIQFDGDWGKLNPEDLAGFKPWNVR